MRFIEKRTTPGLAITGTSGAGLWDDVVTTDETFKGNRKYLFIVNARIRGGSTSKSFSFRTIQDHNGSELTYKMTREPMNTTIEHSYNAATVFTPKIDTTVTFQQMSNESEHPSTYHCYMVALDITELEEGTDYFYEEDTTGVPVSVTHTNIATGRNSYILEAVDINHPTDKMGEKAGAWMIIGGSQIDVEDTSGDSFGMRLSNGRGVGGIFVADQEQFMQEEGEDVIDIASNFLMMPIEVGSNDANHRFRLHTWDSVGSSPGNKYLRSYIIGLNIDIFKDVNFKYDDTDYSNDVAIEQTMEEWSDTPSQTGKYFVLCCGVFDAGGTTANWETSFDVTADGILDHDTFDLVGLKAGRANDFKDELPFVVLGLIDVEKASPNVYTWRFNKYTSAVRGWEDAGYVAFSLAYDYEEFYDKLEIVKIGEVRRKKSAPHIPTIG